jgi:hypothetical protein
MFDSFFYNKVGEYLSLTVPPSCQVTKLSEGVMPKLGEETRELEGQGQ